MSKLLSDQVIGHLEAMNTLNVAIQSGKMHHGWIFQGSKGIGKNTLAMHFAMRILNVAQSASHKRLDIIEGHPDLRHVQCPIGDNGKPKSEIPVSEIRKLVHFFSLRPAQGGWRIAIIDSLDELNRNGQNALLKTLEEPPSNSLLILINHGEAAVLSTIRSRCRVLKMAKLNDDESRRVMINNGVSEKEAEHGLYLSQGQPGVAMKLLEPTILDAVKSVRTIAKSSGSLDAGQLVKLIANCSKSAEAFEAAIDELNGMVVANAKQTDQSIIAGEWSRLHFDFLNLVSETKALNQDRAQAISQAVFKYKHLTQRLI